MQLTQLHLRNWRSYRNATFDLPGPDRSGKRNVILIGAQNGVGKTSFLMALYLGLFGREAIDLIEGFRRSGADDGELKSYKKLIESLLHRPARDAEDPHCSVSLTFTDDEGSLIVIQRRWNFLGAGRVRNLDSKDGEEILIETNGRKKLCDSWQDANNRIQELIFPSNVMPCLFFDGEQAQERVEAAGGRALFDAVKTLYGTGILDQLGDSLRTFISNERSAIQRDVGVIRVDELEEKRQLIDKKRDELAEVQSHLSDSRKLRSKAEDERQRLENELYAMVGDKASDIEEYASTVAALQAEEAKFRQELVGGINQIPLSLALSRASNRVASVLRAEQIRDRWLLIKDEASGKAATIVDQVLPVDHSPDVSPPLLDVQSRQLRKQLEVALEALWSPPPEGCAATFQFPFLQNSDRVAILHKISKFSSAGGGGLADTAINLQSVETRLKETKARFERVKDIQPQLQKLKADLQKALDDHREAQNLVAGYEHKERGIQTEISDLRGAIGQMEGRQEKVSPIQQKLDIAQRVRDLVDDAKDQLVTICKDALEDRCTKHFRAMISDEYTKFKARFEADSEPWLEGPTGQQVLVSTMSGAQKRAFGLAFSLAVADVSGTEAPMVIDTPVGNMDSNYRAKVLRYVADAAPGQVIILSHDEEVSGVYVDQLKSKIRKQFLVEFHQVSEGSGASSVREDQYF
jgi:DNA sulfur modification protein DndD